MKKIMRKRKAERKRERARASDTVPSLLPLFSHSKNSQTARKRSDEEVGERRLVSKGEDALGRCVGSCGGERWWQIDA